MASGFLVMYIFYSDTCLEEGAVPCYTAGVSYERTSRNSSAGRPFGAIYIGTPTS